MRRKFIAIESGTKINVHNYCLCYDFPPVNFILWYFDPVLILNLFTCELCIFIDLQKFS
jgi:hypothetical protein